MCPIREMVRVIRENMGPAGKVLVTGTRNQRLEDLAMLPAVLLYAGAIAAVDGFNYGALRALTTDAVVGGSIFQPDLKVAAIAKAAPEEVVSDDRDLMALRADQAGDGELDERTLAAIAAGEYTNGGSPTRPSCSTL